METRLLGRRVNFRGKSSGLIDETHCPAIFLLRNSLHPIADSHETMKSCAFVRSMFLRTLIERKMEEQLLPVQFFKNVIILASD